MSSFACVSGRLAFLLPDRRYSPAPDRRPPGEGVWKCNWHGECRGRVSVQKKEEKRLPPTSIRETSHTASRRRSPSPEANTSNEIQPPILSFSPANEAPPAPSPGNKTGTDGRRPVPRVPSPIQQNREPQTNVLSPTPVLFLASISNPHTQYRPPNNHYIPHRERKGHEESEEQSSRRKRKRKRE